MRPEETATQRTNSSKNSATTCTMHAIEHNNPNFTMFIHNVRLSMHKPCNALIREACYVTTYVSHMCLKKNEVLTYFEAETVGRGGLGQHVWTLRVGRQLLELLSVMRIMYKDHAMVPS
jgi:hypothetical protein